MIKEIDNLNNIFKNYLKELENLEKEKEEKLKALDRYQDLKEKQIRKKYDNIINKRSKLFEAIYNSSFFSLKQIGPILAKLISEFEGKNYTFENGNISVTLIDFNEMYMYKEPDKIYNCAIITDSSLSRIDKENDIMLYTNNSINEYIGEGDLVLYLDPYYKEKINFYDEHGKYLIKNKYPYIKEFIDNVIISKINNPGKLDLNNELSKFITENKPKVKKL